jgi:hypothetical protein
MKIVTWERGFSPSEKLTGSNMWHTICDGMPTQMGCGNQIETSVPFKRPGKKSSGWLITWGSDGTKDDKSYLCAFCPECAPTVEKQMKDQR